MKYYINEDGNTVFTSQYHRAKNSCCHSNCLHCPYGTTLKNIGVEIHGYEERNKQEIEKLYDQLYNIKDSFTASLIGEAFGKTGTRPEASDLSLLTLKNIPCGLIEIKNREIRSFKLLEHFSDQGITETYLNSIL